MKYIFLASFAVAVIHCEPPVYIEELEELVTNKAEKLELRNLAENEDMVR